MAMPTSRIATATVGSTVSAGAVPADATITRPWAWCAVKAAAI